MLLAAALVCVGYFFGARVGSAFTIHRAPVSTLWPPNSMLLALTPTRSWALPLSAALPAHLAVQLANHISVTMIRFWCPERPRTR